MGYDGDVYLTIVLNGLIHTIMYTYYFVSLHTKGMHSLYLNYIIFITFYNFKTLEIWWKSALTMCQMIQFVLMNAQAAWLIYSDCKTFPVSF